MMGSMQAVISQLFPLIYGACFVVLLWQAFQVMRRGFTAVAPPDLIQPPNQAGDRTGQPTIHPELLDAEGRLTSEDLLTVRFGDDHGGAAERATPAE